MNKTTILNRWLITALMTFGLLQTAMAEVHLGDVDLAGNGCPGGDNVYVFHSQYSGRLIVVFWEYEVDQAKSSSRILRQACSAAIPFSLPEGERLIMESPAMGGYFDLDSETTLQTKLEAFIAGESSPEVKGTIETNEYGETSRYYFRDDNIQVVSKCGEEGILRLNTSLLLKGKGGTSKASVKTAAVTLKTEPCGVN
ncbi:MAG: DUF4360 domain-containing protein [Bdellovibrionales bacterium]|nr:DUF4360 domain-containing protein [Bdellovibrionales bacterium]